MGTKTSAALKPVKSVVILGCAKKYLPLDHENEFAAYDEIWAINNAATHYATRADRIVAMDDLERDYAIDKHKGYVNSIVKAGIPVIGARKHKQWPSVVPYPLQAVADHFKFGAITPYLFDNTVNYTLALALYLGAKKIRLFGCSFTRADDKQILSMARENWINAGYGKAPDWFDYYEKVTLQWRRPLEPGGDACHFWLGYASAKRVELKLDGDGTLLNLDRKPFFYGYEKQPKVRYEG